MKATATVVIDRPIEQVFRVQADDHSGITRAGTPRSPDLSRSETG